MSTNSPRTYLSEAVVAASGPGGGGREAAGRDGLEGAAVEALLVKFYTQAIDAPGANSDKFQQPEGRVEVPPTQFILGVADVPVVQSIPQVQRWSRCSCSTVVDVLVVLVIDMVVHSLEERRRGGLAGAGGCL